MSGWGHLRAGVRFGNGRGRVLWRMESGRVEGGVKETGKDEVLWDGDRITDSLWLLLLVLVLVLGRGDWSSGTSSSGGGSSGTRNGAEGG